MLLEAVAMLSLDASREIGIFVINTADMSWQLVQELLKQKKQNFLSWSRKNYRRYKWNFSI